MFHEIPVDLWARHLGPATRIQLMTVSKGLRVGFRGILHSSWGQVHARERSIKCKRTLHVRYVELMANFFRLYRVLVKINLLHIKNISRFRSPRVSISHRFLRRVFEDPDITALFQGTLVSILGYYLTTNQSILISTTTTTAYDDNDEVCRRVLQIHDYVELTHRYLTLVELDAGQESYTLFSRKVAVILCHVYNILFLIHRDAFTADIDQLREDIQLEQQELLILSSGKLVN